LRGQKKVLEGSTIEKLFTLIILACVFLSALNFINRYYYCIYIAMLFFLITPKRKVSMNASSVALLLFSMSILIFNPSSHTMFTNMIKPFTYPLCYIMGTSLFVRDSKAGISLEKEERKVSAVIYVLTLGVMLHFLLNMLTNRGITSRHVIDFWTKDEASATSQAVLACLMIGVAVSFLFSKVGKFKKIIAIVALCVIVAYNLVLAGRTIFALIIVTTVFALICTCIVKKKNILKTVFIVLIIVAVLFLLYSVNLFGIKSMFESSNFYDRFTTNQDIDEDARMTHKLAYVKYFFDYPWGGGNIRELYGHSAHDLYLDTYDESSIFALITIAVYIVQSLGRMIKCFKAQSLTFKTRLLVACVYVVCNIQFWLEPIIRGVPWLLASYCFIDGVVTNLLTQEKRVSYDAKF